MVYVIPSSVQDHYILYSEEREPRHQIRMVKLLGESYHLLAGSLQPAALPFLLFLLP